MEVPRKATETLWIASISAEIRAEHVPTKTLEYYRYDNLLRERS
jgi:hypothetical protein